MRSDAIDQLLSTYLEMPARVSWDGALAESALGRFEGARLELAGVAVLALPFDRLVLESDSFRFTPGIPARIAATGPRLILSFDQRQLDLWLKKAPFSLVLTERAVEFRMDVAGLPLGRTETEIEIRRGWFILKPKRAEFLGLQTRLASLFQTYLPLPRLAPETRLTGIEHAAGSIRLELTLDDFEDEITPGLVERLQHRFIPFAKPLAAWTKSQGKKPASSTSRSRARR